MATVNPWKRFINLLPDGGRVVGTVVWQDKNAGITRVQLRNGTELSAQGVDVEIGRKVFIKDGQVVGPAPELPQFDIEV
ncbi:hypothetical protein VQ643_15985 [Pseudomonas sp. F1_0610]|uniref:hypothetical protein n=1 Tax=Pseudomonas sp. F1_0610 TaxID=3114284 RepID=UPI0039C2457B